MRSATPKETFVNLDAPYGTQKWKKCIEVKSEPYFLWIHIWKGLNNSSLSCSHRIYRILCLQVSLWVIQDLFKMILLIKWRKTLHDLVKVIPYHDTVFPRLGIHFCAPIHSRSKQVVACGSYRPGYFCHPVICADSITKKRQCFFV